MFYYFPQIYKIIFRNLSHPAQLGFIKIINVLSRSVTGLNILKITGELADSLDTDPKVSPISLIF